jgi:hypothetical protein
MDGHGDGCGVESVGVVLRELARVDGLQRRSVQRLGGEGSELVLNQKVGEATEQVALDEQARSVLLVLVGTSGARRGRREVDSAAGVPP